MTNLTQKLVIGAAALVAGLVFGWATRGVTGYSPATQSMTSFDAWRVACPAANQKDASCEMIQDFVDSQSHSQIARIAVGKLPGGKPAMDITMFLGVALEPGVGLSVGTDKAHTVQYRTCTQQGCIADIPIDDKLQASLDAGKDVKLVFGVVNNDKLIGMPLTLKGYGDAKRTYNREEAKRGSWFWRMWS
jgi:invasion protein IalB